MEIGVRAGADPSLGLPANDFAGTLAAIGAPPGTIQVGRVFPSSAALTAATTPDQVRARLDAACAPALAAGQDPAISFKPDPVPAARGELDPLFTVIGRWAVALHAATGRRLRLIPWHEPQNDEMSARVSGDVAKHHTNHVGRAANWRGMYVRVYQVVKGVAGDAVEIGPCDIVRMFAPGDPATADGAVLDAWRLPPDLYDRRYGDLYVSDWSYRNTAYGGPLWGNQAFTRWREALGVPWDRLVLAERGITRTFAGQGTPTPQVSDGPSEQAMLLAGDLWYMLLNGAAGFWYWNSGGGTDGTSVYLLGAPGRATLAKLAGVAAAWPPPVGPADLARAAAAGSADGRRETLLDVAAWATSQANGGPAG